MASQRIWPLTEITGYLEQIAGMESSNRSFGRFVLDYGAEWASQAVPRQYEGGIPKRCFGNCQEILFSKQGREDGLTYIEGYACSGGVKIPFPTLHAWLVDPDGNVIDPTWEDAETSTYYGVPFTPEYVRRATREAHVGISLIDNFESRWELLRKPELAEEAVLQLDVQTLGVAR